MVFLNKSLLSAVSIAAMPVPKTLTLYFSKILLSASSTPQFNAVCPPNPRSIPLGLSFSMIFLTNSGFIGRK
jgi:hypothetical protein